MSKQQQTTLQQALAGLSLAKPTQDGTKTAETTTVLFKKELPKTRMEVEFMRKVALECGKRCMMQRELRPSEVQADSYIAKRYQQAEREEMEPSYQGIGISPSEQVCLNRCISKVNNVRELVDFKLIHSPTGGIEVDFPPILFNQNLP